MIEYICLGFFILVGFLFLIVLAPLLGPGHEEREALERERRLEEAKIKLLEARAEQVKDQTQGIVNRYKLTKENQINAMIRQQKQELEIEKLRSQNELLRRELGKTNDFTPDE